MKKNVFLIFIWLFFFSYSFAQQVESFKTDDGETLYYTKKGTGPRVVLLCGGPGWGANVMLHWLDSLGNNFECILFEQRGTGLSANVTIDSSTINVDRACMDLENLRTHLGEKKLCLTGYSWGGMLALAYAAKYPDNVKNVVPVSTGMIDTASIKPYLDDLWRDTYTGEWDSIAYWSTPAVRKQDSVKADRMKMIFSVLYRFYDHNLGRRLAEDYLSISQVNNKV